MMYIIFSVSILVFICGIAIGIFSCYKLKKYNEKKQLKSEGVATTIQSTSPESPKLVELPPLQKPKSKLRVQSIYEQRLSRGEELYDPKYEQNKTQGNGKCICCMYIIEFLI